MTTGLCVECGHAFQVTELAPLYEDRRKDPPRLISACRRCVTAYLRQGLLYAENPFWRRQQGVEVGR